VSDLKKIQYTSLSIFTIFLLWTISYVVISNPLLLPSPLQVVNAFFGLFIHAKSLTVMFATTIRLIFALLCAFVIGFILGIIAAFSKGFHFFIKPMITIFRTVPVISIVVILLILFGFNSTPYIITSLMIVPIIFQSVYDGLTSIEPEMIDVYRLEDNHFFTGLRFCYLPFISKNIKTSLLQSGGLGIKVLVMAEFLSQTKNSIGNALYLAKVNLAYDEVFAWTILLILLAILIEFLIERSKVFQS